MEAEDSHENDTGSIPLRADRIWGKIILANLCDPLSHARSIFNEENLALPASDGNIAASLSFPQPLFPLFRANHDRVVGVPIRAFYPLIRSPASDQHLTILAERAHVGRP